MREVPDSDRARISAICATRFRYDRDVVEAMSHVCRPLNGHLAGWKNRGLPEAGGNALARYACC